MLTFVCVWGENGVSMCVCVCMCTYVGVRSGEMMFLTQFFIDVTTYTDYFNDQKECQQHFHSWAPTPIKHLKEHLITFITFLDTKLAQSTQKNQFCIVFGSCSTETNRLAYQQFLLSHRKVFYQSVMAQNDM